MSFACAKSSMHVCHSSQHRSLDRALSCTCVPTKHDQTVGPPVLVPLVTNALASCHVKLTVLRSASHWRWVFISFLRAMTELADFRQACLARPGGDRCLGDVRKVVCQRLPKRVAELYRQLWKLQLEEPWPSPKQLPEIP